VGFLDSPAPLSYRHRQWILEQWQEQHPTTTVYANQHLTLVPRSRVSVADWEQAELELDYEQNMNAYWAECETEMPRAGGHIP
jgi:hypothetical protein